MSTEDVSDSESVKAEHVIDLIDALIGRLNQDPTLRFAAMLSHALDVIAHGVPLSSNVDEGGTVFRLAELIRGQFETPNHDFPLHSMELTAANLAGAVRTSMPMPLYHPRFIHVVDLIVHSIYSHPPRMWRWVQTPPEGSVQEGTDERDWEPQTAELAASITGDGTVQETHGSGGGSQGGGAGAGSAS
jgi:hypothetical protein